MTSERGLIAELLRYSGKKQKNTIVPPGDDAYVWEIAGEYQALSTDTFIDNIHFRFDYFTPQQIGAKAFEASISDIVAMGAQPVSVLISIALPKDLPSLPRDSISSIYEGIDAAAQARAVEIAGGETTSTEGPLVLTVTAVGSFLKKEHLCQRSDAKQGDLVYVTGPVGSSAAGLEILCQEREGYPALRAAHLSPVARVDLIPELPEYVNAMIDVSDGLSTEIHHICNASGCGAILDLDNIPLHQELISYASSVESDPLQYALNGGEDFQLLYTVSPERAENAIGTCIGEITAQSEVLCRSNGVLDSLLPDGYDHLKE